MGQVLTDKPGEDREACLQAPAKEHRENLDGIVAELLDKHGLRLRFEEPVHHDDNDAVRRLAPSV